MIIFLIARVTKLWSYDNIYNIRSHNKLLSVTQWEEIMTLSKLQTCLLKQPLANQKKDKLRIKVQSISVFFYIRKASVKNVDVSRTEGSVT